MPAFVNVIRAAPLELLSRAQRNKQASGWRRSWRRGGRPHNENQLATDLLPGEKISLETRIDEWLIQVPAVANLDGTPKAKSLGQENCLSSRFL
jgi:hypothetical protein